MSALLRTAHALAVSSYLNHEIEWVNEFYMTPNICSYSGAQQNFYINSSMFNVADFSYSKANSNLREKNKIA
jgi:hypothetical protein